MPLIKNSQSLVEFHLFVFHISIHLSLPSSCQSFYLSIVPFIQLPVSSSVRICQCFCSVYNLFTIPPFVYPTFYWSMINQFSVVHPPTSFHKSTCQSIRLSIIHSWSLQTGFLSFRPFIYSSVKAIVLSICQFSTIVYYIC